EYLYLSNASRISSIGSRYDIDFSSSRSIEVSSSLIPEKEQKFIAVDHRNLAGRSFMERVPREVREFLDGVPFHFLCPAVMPARERFSIYTTAPWIGGRIAGSIIDELVGKVSP